MAGGSTNLDTYAKGPIETVDGWLGDVDIFAIKAIGEWQAAHGIEGDLAEIGVHHGKLYFLLALMRRASEKAIAIDLYEDDSMNDVGVHARRDIMLFKNAERLGIPVSDAEIWKVDSTTITPQDIAAKVSNVRIFSVDGGHEYHHVAADLRNAAAVLGEYGVIVIDDFFGKGWPDVTVAAIHMLTEYPDLRPFLITQSKLYVCPKDAAPDYRAMLTTYPGVAGMPKDERNMFRHPVTVMRIGRWQFFGRRLLRRIRRMG